MMTNNSDKFSTYAKKVSPINGTVATSKIKPQPLIKKTLNNTIRTTSEESINENSKTVPKTTKPVSVITCDKVSNSDQKSSVKTSKIPGLTSVENKTVLQINTDKKPKLKMKTIKKSRNNESEEKTDSQFNNNSIIEPNLNEFMSDDVSEGVWIIRKELCPDTVCIK